MAFKHLTTFAAIECEQNSLAKVGAKVNITPRTNGLLSTATIGRLQKKAHEYQNKSLEK